MDAVIRAEIAALAADRTSSATALAARAIALLRRAGSPDARDEIGAELARAQPSMAGFRTIPAFARKAPDARAALDWLAARLERAPAAVARATADLILLGHPPARAVRIVTCSRSVMVESALVALARGTPVTVCCAEGRPALEGRGLAQALAAQGLAVELFSDAAIGSAIPAAEAVLVGADAICRTHFINKVGTAPLCALAASVGVPVYVLTGQEKVLSARLFEALPLGSGPADEIWESAQEAGVKAVNPYFEVISTEFVASVVTDRGVVGVEQVEALGLI
jgi:ribose 1,5-bisphosphate isomerase